MRQVCKQILERSESSVGQNPVMQAWLYVRSMCDSYLISIGRADDGACAAPPPKPSVGDTSRPAQLPCFGSSDASMNSIGPTKVRACICTCSWQFQYSQYPCIQQAVPSRAWQNGKTKQTSPNNRLEEETKTRDSSGFGGWRAPVAAQCRCNTALPVLVRGPPCACAVQAVVACAQHCAQRPAICWRG